MIFKINKSSNINLIKQSIKIMLGKVVIKEFKKIYTWKTPSFLLTKIKWKKCVCIALHFKLINYFKRVYLFNYTTKKETLKKKVFKKKF